MLITLFNSVWSFLQDQKDVCLSSCIILLCPGQAEQCLQHLTIATYCRRLVQKTTLLKLPCSNQAPCGLESPVIGPEWSMPSSLVDPFSSLCTGF